MKYIDADNLRKELNKLRDIQPSTSGLPRKSTYEAMGVIQTIDNVLHIIDSRQQDEKAIELEMCSQAYWEERGWMMIPPDVTLEGIESLLKQVRKKLGQEQPEVDLEKAARNVYESWMGGTMDDVRRDMVELGTVLNARKEE